MSDRAAGKGRGLLRFARAAAAAGAVISLANLLGLLSSDGYHYPGVFAAWMPLSVGAAWALTAALTGAHWLTTAALKGTRTALKGIGRLGPVTGAVAATGYAALTPWSETTIWLAAAVGALSVAAYLLAWSSFGGRSAPARAALAVATALVLVMLPSALLDEDHWASVFAPESTVFATAEADGWTKISGVGVEHRKVGLADDWRNATVVSAGGFFMEECFVDPGDLLVFHVARHGNSSGWAMVTAVPEKGVQATLWREEFAKLPADRWLEVSVPVPTSGNTQAVFEVEGEGEGTAFFANQRFEKVRTSGEAAASAGPAPGTKNVILMVQDAMRPDHLGLYGYQRRTSPNIDRLAQNAVVFDTCVAQAPWTLPSVSTILTGLYPSAHGIDAIGRGMPGGIETIGEAFRASGYRTCAIQANPHLDPSRGFARGFDEYRFMLMRTSSADDPHQNQRAAELNSAALAWIDRNANARFFMYVHYMDIHIPYFPPREFQVFPEEGKERSEADWYDAGILYFDSEFDALWKALEARGLLEDTIIVLTADHGEQFEEYGATGHGNCLYEEEVRVPLAIWAPGMPGRRVEGPTELVDLPATLLDMAGARPLAQSQGRSLAPAARGETLEAKDVFSELLERQLYPSTRIISLTRGNTRVIYETEENGRMGVGRAFASRAADNPAPDPEELYSALKSWHAVQVGVNKRLVKENIESALSAEERARLMALGYLTKGQEAGGDGRQPGNAPSPEEAVTP